MATHTSLVKRVLIEGAGWIMVVAGVAALILPGPGLLLLFAGLAILSQQYTWAERRLQPVKVKALKTAADSVQTWPRIIASTLGAVVLVGFGVLFVVSPPAPSWWPLRDSWWLIGGWPAGITLILSGLIALAMVVYSFFKFRDAPDPHGAAEATGRS